MKGRIMKSSRKFAVLIIALASSFGFFSAPANAQTTAPGPYYATPSWDQQLPASTRFIVLANWNSEAVLDRETGLVWEKAPSQTTMTWFFANSRCNNLNTGGRQGWRLPKLPELLSLADRSQPAPQLPAGHPFSGITFGVNAPPGGIPLIRAYWSATDGASTSAEAEMADFGRIGEVSPQKTMGESGFFFQPYAWCVRGPGGLR